ncbi:MAG: hypothetical protein L3J98_16220 [Gammaproteobacteria bacterium]|nr:hypothetical protein [Gammaproteobacteria bacterium]MCF6261682.1 hypothetical protein [Gammaproteobacteria bacterium]
MENAILDGCNQLGCLVTAEALSRFDADDTLISLCSAKLTSRTQTNKTYFPSYGKIYCPLETSAKILSRKYARLNEDSHGCKISNCYLQQATDWMGAVAQSKEEVRDYSTPELDENVKIISMSLDGAMLPMRDGDWKETMVLR